jgi:hypothetical protein
MACGRKPNHAAIRVRVPGPPASCLRVTGISAKRTTSSTGAGDPRAGRTCNVRRTRSRRARTYNAADQSITFAVAER